MVSAPPDASRVHDGASSQHGSVRATFVARDGRTLLDELACQSPLKIARPFARADGGLDVCVMEVSPGLLAGDHYQLDWRVGVGARVHIRTQSHLRVHPAGIAADADAPGRGATQHQQLQVGRDALVELLPEPVVPFAGADFRGSTQVLLEEGAVAIVADVASAGRIAATEPECFAFERFESAFEARIDGRLVVASRQRIDAQRHRAANLVESPGALGGCSHWGTLYIVSSRLDSECAAALVTLLQDPLIAADESVALSVDALDSYAVAVQVLGHSAWALTTTMHAAARIADKELAARPSRGK